MPMVPREKYPEMNWRAADKVAAWKFFKRRMNVIFVADQIPEERQWALILVAGGDKAYNCWDTLEETVTDCKQVEQVWNAFEKSFEQSTSFWHFRVHGLFKSICRFGANPEKVLCIQGGAMQVYHQNQ